MPHPHSSGIQFRQGIYDGWLGTEKAILPLLDTPAGIEGTDRREKQGNVMFIVNHNFVLSIFRCLRHTRILSRTGC